MLINISPHVASLVQFAKYRSSTILMHLRRGCIASESHVWHFKLEPVNRNEKFKENNKN